MPNKPPHCVSLTLAVRGGGIEANWLTRAKKAAAARGAVAADGTVELKLSTWNPRGNPINATLAGRISDDTMSASGQWGNGNPVSGNWKRMQAGPAEPAASDVPKLVVSHDGTYSGRLCNQLPNKAPFCWPVALVVRDGSAEGSWIGSTKKKAEVRGAVAADGLIRLKLTSVTPNGTPVEANLIGRIVDGAITASGQWRNGGSVAGDWKRTP